MTEHEGSQSGESSAIVPAIEEEARGWLVAFSETLGDAFDALVGLPGMRRNLAKAVSQVVLGVADVGEAVLDIGKAKAQQHAARIRATTGFEQAVVEQAVKAVGAGEDPLEQRAKLHDFFDSRRKQRNREAVLEATLLGIRDRNPSVDAQSELDDDWLMHFSEVAGKISDEGARAFLSAMLRGEIAQPGSFSVEAVLRISTMSPRVAESFKQFSDHVSVLSSSAGILVEPQQNPAQNGLPDLGLSWDDLSELQSAGLVKVDLSTQTTLSEVPANTEIHFAFCGRPAVLRTTKAADKIVLRLVLATRSGKEILAANSPPAVLPMGYAVRLQDWFRTAHGIELTF